MKLFFGFLLLLQVFLSEGSQVNRQPKILSGYNKQIQGHTEAGLAKLETAISSLEKLASEIKKLQSSEETYNLQKLDELNSISNKLTEGGDITNRLQKLDANLRYLLFLLTSDSVSISLYSRLSSIYQLLATKLTNLENIVDYNEIITTVPPVLYCNTDTDCLLLCAPNNYDTYFCNSGTCSSKCETHAQCSSLNGGNYICDKGSCLVGYTSGECFVDSQCYNKYGDSQPFCDTWLGPGFCVSYCRNDYQCSIKGLPYCKIVDTDYGYCSDTATIITSTITTRAPPFDECFADLHCFIQFKYDKPFCDGVICVSYCKENEQCMSLYGTPSSCITSGIKDGYCSPTTTTPPTTTALTTTVTSVSNSTL